MQKSTINPPNIRITRSKTLKDNLSKITKKTPTFSESIQGIQKTIQNQSNSQQINDQISKINQINPTTTQSIQTISNKQLSTSSEEAPASPVELSSVATQSSQSSIPTNLSNLSKKISNADVTPYLTAAKRGLKTSTPNFVFENPASFSVYLEENGNHDISNTNDVKILPNSLDYTPKDLIEELNLFCSSQLHPTIFDYGADFSAIPLNFSLEKEKKLDGRGKAYHLLHIIEHKSLTKPILEKVLQHLSHWRFSSFAVKTFNPQGFTKLASFKLTIPKVFHFLEEKIVNSTFMNLGTIILQKSEYDESSKMAFFDDEVYSHFVLVDLKHQLTPRKHPLIKHAGKYVQVEVLLNSYLRHCTYCQSTEHSRRACTVAAECPHCLQRDHPPQRCPIVRNNKNLFPTEETSIPSPPHSITTPPATTQDSAPSSPTPDPETISIAENWADDPHDFMTDSPPQIIKSKPLVSKHAPETLSVPEAPTETSSSKSKNSENNIFQLMDCDSDIDDLSDSPHSDSSSVIMEVEEDHHQDLQPSPSAGRNQDASV